MVQLVPSISGCLSMGQQQGSIGVIDNQLRYYWVGESDSNVSTDDVFPQSLCWCY